jgi:hypothetical protein
MFSNTDGIATGQYLIVKYRIPATNANNDKVALQFFLSTEHGLENIQDPNDSFYVTTEGGQVIADGEWRVFVIDTASYNKSSIKPNSNGEYKIQYVRFDAFNGIKTADGNFVDGMDLSCFALHDNLDEILEYFANDGISEITLIEKDIPTQVSTAGN